MARSNKELAKKGTRQSGGKGQKSGVKAASPAAKDAQKANRPALARERDAVPFIDDRARRDIGGVVFAVIAVVLFVAATIKSDAPVTSFVSNSLHMSLGLGAYLLPFVFLIIGVSFLVRFERVRVARVGVGLAIIFIAVLALTALATPLAVNADPVLLFEPRALAAHGGYLGAGIAWAGLTLLGQVVSCVILIGAIVAGLIVIGFSLSGPLERLIAYLKHETPDDETGTAGSAGPAFARVQRMPNPAMVRSAPEAAETAVLPAGMRKPRRALGSLKTHSLSPDATFDPAQGADAQLTRRLGTRPDKADIPHAGAGNAPRSAPERLGSAQGGPIGTAPARPQEGFVLPKMNLLKKSAAKGKTGTSEEELKETALLLQETLEDFNIFATVVGWVAGPTVTLFKVDLPSGVRVSRVTALEDDIALALAAPGVRIFAPIPGTNYVGIEVPNQKRQVVLLGDILPKAPEGPLQIAIGMDVEGRAIISDLARMPHLLIGGTTGSGKSVSVNAMIMSILMRATPTEVRFVMIDPKRVEFTPYNGIPHLYVPVVTEPREAASALAWGVAEMERRLKVFSQAGARNIAQYNAKCASLAAQAAASEQGSQAGQAKDAAVLAQSTPPGQGSPKLPQEPPQGLPQEPLQELPYIVIVIDELADLMMNVGKEVEFSISRIAQLARAAGIHLIVATQRPSTNVVTGLIKANITNRIAFNVASGIDSRVVLDTPGAENLIGLGDLLLSKPEYAKPQRIQGCYVSEEEINAVVDQLKTQGTPEYHAEILKTNLITLGASSPEGNGGGTDDDPLVWEAAEIVVSTGLGSTSNIQRRLKVGYSRAGRIMDMLEEKGVVGPPNGSKPRDVLVDEIELETLKAFEAQDGRSTQSFAEE
ncbi:MAG: DNA translocase FtsK [Coriobacteriaceae bacterium]|nr:DNA translocase FtsK [Coriobacteriaceae bacterium]